MYKGLVVSYFSVLSLGQSITQALFTPKVWESFAHLDQM